ncbi:MAG TPA: biopolymer transporter ExbD [Chitinophagaceae bacterium]|jgi:biopolymer transport protein ExbD|nr:biopolymer transporter ExbD [Chitinophagaceae bacterium]
MKFRKKHRTESEVFTDSLNDILFILLMFFLITTTQANPNVKAVNTPHASKDRKVKQTVTVSIDAAQKVYIGQREVPPALLDSFLKIELDKHRKFPGDTLTVVVNADSISYHAGFIKVLEAAKKNNAKVAVNVKN